MSIEPEEIGSLHQLMEHIEIRPQDRPMLLFRGEANKFKSPCTPLILRDFQDSYLDIFGGVQGEYSRVREWKKQVELLEGNRLPASSDLETMILARHHDLNVRLLDWSTNPLVSCWFACGGSGDDVGCIYSTDQPTALDFTSEFQERQNPQSDKFNALVTNPFCRSVPAHIGNELKPFFKTHFFRPTTLPNNRLTSQGGVVSIHPNPNKDDQFRPYLHFIILPKEKKAILDELNILGINEMSLGLSTRDSIASKLNKSEFPF